MVRIPRLLVFLMAIMIAILVHEVYSYPTYFSESVCSSRSYGRRGHIRGSRPCPSCHVCRYGSCRFSGCRTPYDDIYKKMALCVILGIDRREVGCARLRNNDDQMGRRVEKSWKLPLKNDSSVSGVGIEVDKVKNAFIGLIDTQQIRFLIYNADIELVADLDLGSIDEKYSNRTVDAIRLGDDFCLVEVSDSKPDTKDDPHVVKCISTSKYVNATW